MLILAAVYNLQNNYHLQSLQHQEYIPYTHHRPLQPPNIAATPPPALSLLILRILKYDKKIKSILS